MAYTDEQRQAARQELARRELAKRQQTNGITPQNEEDPGALLDNLPEPEGFFKKLPRNILAGLGNLQRNVFNTPHDLVQNVENQGEKLRQGLPVPKGVTPQMQELLYGKSSPKLSNAIPHQPEFNYPEFFGQQGEGTLLDNLIQQGVENAPALAGIGGLLRSGIRKYPVTRKGAARQLKGAEKAIKERGINNFQMNHPLLQETIPFLPKTHATGEMLQGVINGEYAPAFALQSQIGQHARNLSKSPLAAERLLAPKVRELKQLILHEMEQALRGTGHHDVAEMLKGGLGDYAKYMKFREKALPILKKIGIPSTGLAFLGLGTNQGKKLISKLID